MTSNSAGDSSSIFKDGKLKSGIYKIRNLVSGTYLDIHEHLKQTCCRPARDLEDGRGLVRLYLPSAVRISDDQKWEIKSFGVGYTVQMVEPGKPDQFCTPMEGLEDRTPLYVTAYSVAWRIEITNDDIHRGFEYVRFYWGPTRKTWDLDVTSPENGAMVRIWEENSCLHQIWRLIPVNVEGVSETLGSGSLPSCGGNATGQSSTRAQHIEPEHDEFGAIVNEVTVVTTTSTVTTRKRYRVEDA